MTSLYCILLVISLLLITHFLTMSVMTIGLMLDQTEYDDNWIYSNTKIKWKRIFVWYPIYAKRWNKKGHRLHLFNFVEKTEINDGFDCIVYFREISK